MEYFDNEMNVFSKKIKKYRRSIYYVYISCKSQVLDSLYSTYAGERHALENMTKFGKI